jgi:hypothetical protein
LIGNGSETTADTTPSDLRLSLALIGCYAVLLLCLLPFPSLWVDELVQLYGATMPLRQLVFQYTASIAGGVPLSYATEWVTVHLLGISSFGARLPSALFSIAGGFGMIRLARASGLSQASLCLAIFLTFPLQFRYGAEGRMYSEALCAAVWLAVVFLQLQERVTIARAIAYCSLVALGLYTQPFVLFVCVAHLFYAGMLALRTHGWRLLIATSSAMSAGICLFLPWYVYARQHWHESVNANDLHFRVQIKLPLLILRELVGTGYIGALLILVLAAYGLGNKRLSSNQRAFWICFTLIPPALALIADSAFDYFFAIRQILFILPGLALLTTFGILRLRNQFGATSARIAMAAVLLLNLGYSARWFAKPREDWKRSAAVLRAKAQEGACVVILPGDTEQFYRLFEPTLSQSACTEEARGTRRMIAIAVSPYLHDPQAEQMLQNSLSKQGFSRAESLPGLNPAVVIYRRD